MTKIILSALFVSILFSCKKENQQTDQKKSTSDSVQISEQKPSQIDKISLKEITQDALTENLAKNNDTLYVTNFFATWCGPCMMEIPHFKNEMEELKGKPVKFTFVNIFNKPEWNGEVPKFASQSGLGNHIVLLDDAKLDPSFFTQFKSWKGNGIPFTYFRKGNKTEESEGSVSAEMLKEKINGFLK